MYVFKNVCIWGGGRPHCENKNAVKISYLIGKSNSSKKILKLHSQTRNNHNKNPCLFIDID